MTFYLGCDVSKAKVDVALIDDHGSILWEDKVKNERTILASFLLTVAGAYPDTRVVGVVEATGRYHYPLLDASIAVAVDCVVYNPILTKQGIRSSVRGKKTDRTDAILIARMGLRGEGRLYTPEPYLSTKLQTRSYQKLSEWRQSLGKHTDYLSAMSEAVMTEQVIAVFQAVEDALQTARKELYREIQRSVDGDVFRRIQTIPGIGPFVGACLIGEIQDMARFTRPKHLVAYIGLDPRVRQSGHSLNSTGRLSKRGTPHVRRSLFIAANAARRYDPYFKAFYDKKRSEGKTYKVAICAVSRKLLTVVRAVWLSGGTYDVSFWET